MSLQERWSVLWKTADGQLEAQEPSTLEVETASSQLSSWYNEEHNRSMMSNTELMSAVDVCEHFEKLRDQGGRSFLLFADGRLMGDADLRHIDLQSRTAEFTILVGERAAQGRGFGTRFALMLHALAFAKLGLAHIYVSIIPANRGSLRLFEKLGYQRDDSPAARGYIDEDDDVTMSFARDDFLRVCGDTIARLSIGPA
jgi:RimJ/RimL family protein N-acetyltransferase